MLTRISDHFLRPIAKHWRQDDSMKRVGIARLRTFAKRYNRWRYADRCRMHREGFTDQFPKLLTENGGQNAWPPRVVMRDGWARDDSMTLPHLDRVLEQANEIIKMRGGKEHSSSQQPFLRGLLFPGDLEQYPAILDFITSSEVLATAAAHMKTVPVLSKSLPPGVRFMESNAALDPGRDGPFRESQLYHLDLHDTPLVYVLVLVQDVTEESGPWTFYPAAASAHAKRMLRYQQSGSNYRVTDSEMHSVLDPEDAIVFSGKKGSVLFIDSSACFHYGSRRAIRPRFQLMYGLTTPCRCDLFQTQYENKYPIPANASRLRRMATEPWQAS